MPIQQFFSYIMVRTSYFQWDDDDEVCFVLDQHTELDFHRASSLKQQSTDRHVAPFGQIILIPSQPVFALSSQCCVLSWEATNTNLTVFVFTRPGLEPTIYRTRDEHVTHYVTDAVLTWVIRYIYYWNLQFLMNVIIIQTKILFPQT